MIYNYGNRSIASNRAHGIAREVPRLIDKFVRDWPDVPRIRETFVLAQEFGA